MFAQLIVLKLYVFEYEDYFILNSHHQKTQAVYQKFPILPVSPGPPPDVKSGLLLALDIFPWIDLNYNNIIAAASSM